eukprot:gnl/MRDRNA2_/MRDRNA2_137020_c0_seq1.p1 gnl/MRDRNA2_/MRDRNA2_137020_c0~~gnl/MRDRNA2_/MRDRNA2_137020_c0_seq1.p1  ORF type:complete len:256 (+),score=55.84 gnl/MRDRNA2_/MRDRNA2_137020_c0_seq1:78-845(+)
MSAVARDQHVISDGAELRKLIGEPAEVSAKKFKFTKTLTETQEDFIKRSPFCLLSTVDGEGVPLVSPKGDAPGFVKVVSPDLLLIPDRPGNKLIFGLQNILVHPQVQILFMIPNTCETLRVSGKASLTKDPRLCKECSAGGQDALLVIRVFVTECYYHCAKAFVRSQLWKPESWPQGRFKVKLGQIMAKNAGKDDAWVQEYEKGAAGRLKDVEDHYTKNVWQVGTGFASGPSRQLVLVTLLAVSAATIATVARWR